jgi:antagonist of KipI
MNVLVRSAGFLASVQDLGRTGFRQSGVSVGGALDPHALRVANTLVGNENNAAGIEATLGTLRLQFEDERLVAWCGGRFSVRIGEQDLPAGHAGLVAKDAELVMSAPNDGGRAWLAVAGGIDVPLVLGSRSTDLRGSFGGHEGRALRDGDVLPLGTTGRLKERRFTNRRPNKNGDL